MEEHGSRIPAAAVPPTAETVRLDAVCGMVVKPDSPHRVSHEGTTYLFCSAGCAEKFGARPEAYLEPAEEPGRSRELLVRQLTAPVRWIECVGRMRALGVERFAELGPGRVLAGLNRRNARGVPTVSLGTPESIDQMESAI